MAFLQVIKYKNIENLQTRLAMRYRGIVCELRNA